MRRVHRMLLPLAALAAGGAAAQKSPPAASAIQWADVNGVSLRYDYAGNGPDTVVLLHELGTSLDTWDYVVPALRRGHRVLRYDMRGFGMSSRIAGELTLADEVADLDALLTKLGVQGKVTLVGGAVGGAVAFQYAVTHPERTRGVVAISPAAYLQARTAGTSPAQAGPGPAPAGAAASPTPEQVAEGSYPTRFRAADPARYARFLALTHSGNPEAGRVTAAAAYRVAFAEVLPKITCPVLVVGTSLWIRPSASFRELAQVVPGGRFVDLETGHFAAMASPELLIPVITRFLADTR